MDRFGAETTQVSIPALNCRPCVSLAICSSLCLRCRSKVQTSTRFEIVGIVLHGQDDPVDNELVHFPSRPSRDRGHKRRCAISPMACGVGFDDHRSGYVIYSASAPPKHHKCHRNSVRSEEPQTSELVLCLPLAKVKTHQLCSVGSPGRPLAPAQFENHRKLRIANRTLGANRGWLLILN